MKGKLDVPQIGFELDPTFLEVIHITPLIAHYVHCASPTQSDRPCVAQWLERPLGVRETGVRSPTASHQIRQNWEVFFASQLGAWH